jgi:lysozyme
MNYDREKLIDLIIYHEGLELKPYRCTAGHLTIGIGRNLDDRGITEDEARFLCQNDVDIVEQELARKFPFIVGLGDVRIRVLLDMAFNLGVPRLSAFSNMWAALEEGDFKQAAVEMLDSRWARQVGRRATNLSQMMETGTDG